MTIPSTGSPPLTRVVRVSTGAALAQSRITPAHAGSTAMLLVKLIEE